MFAYSNSICIFITVKQNRLLERFSGRESSWIRYKIKTGHCKKFQLYFPQISSCHLYTMSMSPLQRRQPIRRGVQFFLFVENRCDVGSLFEFQSVGDLEKCLTYYWVFVFEPKEERKLIFLLRPDRQIKLPLRLPRIPSTQYIDLEPLPRRSVCVQKEIILKSKLPFADLCAL